MTTTLISVPFIYDTKQDYNFLQQCILSFKSKFQINNACSHEKFFPGADVWSFLDQDTT